MYFATGKAYGQDSEKSRFLWTKFSSNCMTLVRGNTIVAHVALRMIRIT
jgi:hypothetical protein